MVIAVVLLSMAVAVLLFLYAVKCRKIGRLTEELRDIPKGESNALLHTDGSDESLKKLTSEINALLCQLRQIKVRYNKKSHEMEQMMTNISHDLRTPLTSARGYIALLQNADIPEEEKARELAIVEKRLLRLEELIDAFFEFSQVISGENPPEREMLNLVGVLEESVGHYYDDFRRQNRTITLSCPGNKHMILFHLKMLLRIFDNLIGNAYKHGQGDLQITLTTGECTVIRFENALHDPYLEIDRVFDEFYTTDISRTKGHTGLGLAIAKQFVELLGGEIIAEYKDDVFAVMLKF